MSETAVGLQTKSISEAADMLEGTAASSIIEWALQEYKEKICLTTSFTDTVLLDLVLSVDRTVPVVFLDTGFHFPETLLTMKNVQERYDPDLRVIKPKSGATDLWKTGVEQCCAARKVSGLDSFFNSGDFSAWFSGVRRSDSPARRNTPVVLRDRRNAIKVNPLVAWDDEQAAVYTEEKSLLVNPLLSQGYTSVGCWPCTQKNDDSSNTRAGRWSGSEKTECGLHY